MLRQHFKFSKLPVTGTDQIERPDALTESAGPIRIQIACWDDGGLAHDTAT